MKKDNQMDIYCTVRTNTSYGQSVMDCLEILKDRLGLSASRIMQDALIAYEYSTRNKIPSFRTAEVRNAVRLPQEERVMKEEPRNEDEFRASDILGLSSVDSSEYQM